MLRILKGSELLNVQHMKIKAAYFKLTSYNILFGIMQNSDTWTYCWP